MLRPKNINREQRRLRTGQWPAATKGTANFSVNKGQFAYLCEMLIAEKQYLSWINYYSWYWNILFYHTSYIMWYNYFFRHSVSVSRARGQGRFHPRAAVRHVLLVCTALPIRLAKTLNKNLNSVSYSSTLDSAITQGRKPEYCHLVHFVIFVCVNRVGCAQMKEPWKHY